MKKDLITSSISVFPLLLVSLSLQNLLINAKRIMYDLSSSISPSIQSLFYVPNYLLFPIFLLTLGYFLFTILFTIARDKRLLFVFSLVYSLILFALLKTSIIVLLYLISLSTVVLFFTKKESPKSFRECWNASKVINLANILFSLLILAYTYSKSATVVYSLFTPVVNFSLEHYVKPNVEKQMNLTYQAYMWGFDAAVDILRKANDNQGVEILNGVREEVKKQLRKSLEKQKDEQVNVIREKIQYYLIKYSLIILLVLVFTFYVSLELVRFFSNFFSSIVLYLIVKLGAIQSSRNIQK